MYDPIQGQGQGHGGPKVAKLADFSLSPPPTDVYIYSSGYRNGHGY